jgi:hypothetical protein
VVSLASCLHVQLGKFILATDRDARCAAVYVCDMACFKPLTAWYSKEVNGSGKRSLVFSQQGALQPDQPIEIACGQCHGCRLERSRQWAVRCMHESELHEQNCFLTLTFDDDHLYKRPVPESVDLREFQLFMKKLRERFVPKNPYDYKSERVKFDDWQFDNGIRFFHCGEYGDESGRPHYHALLFNFDFPDKQKFTDNKGFPLYTSEILQELWPYGYALIGAVTFESAAYVARYVMKKVNGEAQEEHYKKIYVDEHGVVIREVDLKPEYITMSRRPGIGARWYKNFKSDVYPCDSVVVNGKKVNPPKFYDKQLEKEDPFLLADLKAARVERALDHYDNNTPERLEKRAQILGRRIDRLTRCL